MKKRYTFLIGSIVIIALIYGGFKIRDWAIGPSKNPHPQYFVTITGNIDPDMRYPVYLAFWAYYFTNNSKCEVYVRDFENGGNYPRSKVDFYPVKINKQGNYTVKIPIDRYKEGDCDWEIRKINFLFEPYPIPKMADRPQDFFMVFKTNSYFDSARPSFKKHLFYNCGKGSFCRMNWHRPEEQREPVVQTKNYHFIQNIK